MDCLSAIASNPLGVCSISKKEEPKKVTVTSIAEVNGKVIVTLDDGTYLETEMSVVDRNLNADIQAREEMNALKAKVDTLATKTDELTNKVTSLENFKSKVLDNLIDVRNFENEVSFKAFGSNTNLN